MSSTLEVLQKRWSKMSSTLEVLQKIWSKMSSTLEVLQKIWSKMSSTLEVLQKRWSKRSSTMLKYCRRNDQGYIKCNNYSICINTKIPLSPAPNDQFSNFLINLFKILWVVTSVNIIFFHFQMLIEVIYISFLNVYYITMHRLCKKY